MSKLDLECHLDFKFLDVGFSTTPLKQISNLGKEIKICDQGSRFSNQGDRGVVSKTKV